ncbi:centrosomal protein of 68 kDa [Plectropomus leopardus]|uniref:centrosomal protein of 68 kDa n=1 Tax=Plectropomus leopardus TaxID=160734 RepID=UPI001C4CF6FF|nr:centrosomal protein of 68 kDa [Plectropomus leopardus]XP_042358706.1 centrosomal protein of 68 kDa [Plectropomus leopardus]
MEARGYSQRWKMHFPEFKHSRRSLSPTTRDSERGKTERDTDRGGTHKSVSMAPTSRYLTDRQYVSRKPLFSGEQYTSILKKTHPQVHTEKEKNVSVSRREENQQHTDMNFLTRPREELTPESFSLSHSDLSPSSSSRKDLDSPMGVSELRSRLNHEEPTFGSPPPGSRPARRNLLSSILEVQRPNPPLRPQLTSTVLHPTYSPRSEHSRLRLGGRDRVGGPETKIYSSGGHSKGHPMSPCQANYWACAIPKALPPSPDRHSADWDPNKEYQDLLDYTYPLRPGQTVCEGDSSRFRGESLLQIDPTLQDSGIELDHLCSSTSLSGFDLSFSVGQRSTDLQGVTRSSDGKPSGTLLSQTDPVGSSSDSLDCSNNRDGMSRYMFDGCYQQQNTPSSSTFTAFTRSTSVLPRSRCVGGDVDEEFWPLPEQLVELQLLSRQVREVTAKLSRPVTASWESLELGTTSILSSVTLPEKQEAEYEEDEAKDRELEGHQDSDEGKDEQDREERSAAQTASDHRACEAARQSSGAWEESVIVGLNPSGLREVEVLVEQLCDITLPSSQRSSQEEQEQSDSLMRHIQVFCSHLQQLIQQLYTVSEKMELLATPIVDMDSVRSSLAEFQSFQREVSIHQPLTSSVLHTGRLLLSCIRTMSPLLRDTLLLIERQSGALESHTEHFFSSILSAKDSFTQPGPVQQGREE